MSLTTATAVHKVARRVKGANGTTKMVDTAIPNALQLTLARQLYRRDHWVNRNGAYTLVKEIIRTTSPLSVYGALNRLVERGYLERRGTSAAKNFEYRAIAGRKCVEREGQIVVVNEASGTPITAEIQQVDTGTTTTSQGVVTTAGTTTQPSITIIGPGDFPITSPDLMPSVTIPGWPTMPAPPPSVVSPLTFAPSTLGLERVVEAIQQAAMPKPVGPITTSDGHELVWNLPGGYSVAFIVTDGVRKAVLANGLNSYVFQGEAADAVWAWALNTAVVPITQSEKAQYEAKIAELAERYRSGAEQDRLKIAELESDLRNAALENRDLESKLAGMAEMLKREMENKIAALGSYTK